MRSGGRYGLWIAVGLVQLAIVAVLLRSWLPSATPVAAPPPPSAEVANAPSPPSDPVQADPEPPREPRPPELLEPESPAGLASVDLEEVRAALPDNLYWELAAPTQDPRLLGDREREKTRRNEQYGRVLSGTGTEEEIRDYYDHRNRMSADYVRFVDYVLDRYQDRLGEQDLELLHVARRLHLARLQEIPRNLQQALDRKREQDTAREAWLADQQAFEAAQRDAADRESAERGAAQAQDSQSDPAN